MGICNADGVLDVHQICLSTLYQSVPGGCTDSLFIAHVDEINASIRNKFHRSFVGVVRRCWKGDSEVDRVRVTLVRESVTFSTTIVLSSGRDSNAKVALQC